MVGSPSTHQKKQSRASRRDPSAEVVRFRASLRRRLFAGVLIALTSFGFGGNRQENQSQDSQGTSASSLFDVGLAYAKGKVTFKHPEALNLFKGSGTKVKVAKVDDKTGEVKEGSYKTLKLRTKNQKMPKGVFHLVAKPGKPGSEIAQSEIPSRRLADKFIDNNGKPIDLDPADFGLEFSSDALPFVFQSRHLRTVAQASPKKSPNVSRLVVAVGLSKDKRVPIELASLQWEHRAQGGIAHALLVAHTSPSFPEVRDGIRPRSFYLRKIATQVHRVIKNGLSSGRADSGKYYDLSVDWVKAPEYIDFALDKGTDAESKPIEGLGVHEERYVYKKVTNTSIAKVRTYYNLVFWVFYGRRSRWSTACNEMQDCKRREGSRFLRFSE